MSYLSVVQQTLIFTKSFAVQLIAQKECAIQIFCTAKWLHCKTFIMPSSTWPLIGPHCHFNAIVLFLSSGRIIWGPTLWVPQVLITLLAFIKAPRSRWLIARAGYWFCHWAQHLRLDLGTIYTHNTGGEYIGQINFYSRITQKLLTISFGH